MSWNPSPTTSGANWQGNAPLVTKNQLLSTTEGLIEILTLSTISSFTTLTASQWISTPLLNVSDIRGQNITIPGVTVDASGVFATNEISSSKADFNLTLVSSLTFKGIDLGGINVSFDFGLGQAIGGLLGGLGALVGGATIAVGTGAGLAIQGAETGIANLIAGRPENYINSNVFETVNFTSQLQVSTLGNLYPLYSTIQRQVSSVSPNQVPGPEIFISSFFQPGQICIRSVSDPFNPITGDSNINTSTIQSFGQWIPLAGLEPEDIIANSLSTNFISSYSVKTNQLAACNAVLYGAGVNNDLSLGYGVPLNFQIGSGYEASFTGSNSYLYFNNYQPTIFSKFGTQENASLYMGTGANQSLLNVSSIFSRGNIQANSGFYSTLQVEQLIVISSLSTVYTQSNVTTLSTLNVTADFIGANRAQISTLNAVSIYPFQFSSILGNPTGPFDITRTDNVISTTYDQISSLQQNILSYSLNAQVQDEPSINIGDAPLGVLYNVTPANVSQWGSTIIVFNGYSNSGTIDLGWVGQWAVSPGTGSSALPGGATFDVLYTSSNAVGAAGNFYILEQSNTSYPAGVSTLYQYIAPAGSGFVGTYTARLTLPPVVGGSRSGWWELVSPAPPPYSTSNNNTFQIYQDINDTYITATDRLHIQAGDIYLQGTTVFSNAQYQNLTTSNLTAYNIFASNTSSQFAYISSLTSEVVNVNPLGGGYNSYYLKSSISYNAGQSNILAANYTFQMDTPNFINSFPLLAPFQGSNLFNSYNASQWNNTVWTNSIQSILGPATIFLGDINEPLGSYAGKFWVNNAIVSPAYPIPVIQITSAGSNLLGTITGNTYGLIQTTNSGTTWTITSNVPNPQGGTQATILNNLQLIQSYSNVQVVGTQSLQIQAPQTNLITEQFNLFADAIRVNSHKYGSAPTANLPSFPIGFQTGTYIDGNISWTQNPFGSGLWQSDATNVIYGIGNLFFDFNSYIALIIPSRFRTNDYPIYSWDVQVAPLGVPGGGYCWGFNRYIQIAAGPSGPGVNTTNNWNEWIMIPRNYCTY